MAAGLGQLFEYWEFQYLEVMYHDISRPDFFFVVSSWCRGSEEVQLSLMSLDRTLLHSFGLDFALTCDCITSCAWRHILVGNNCGTQTTVLISRNVLLFPVAAQWSRLIQYVCVKILCGFSITIFGVEWVDEECCACKWVSLARFPSFCSSIRVKVMPVTLVSTHINTHRKSHQCLKTCTHLPHFCIAFFLTSTRTHT